MSRKSKAEARGVEADARVSAESTPDVEASEAIAGAPLNEPAADGAEPISRELVADEAPSDEIAPEATDSGEAELIAALQAELAEANARAEGYRETMQRSAAEFQNTRKRQERQLAEEIERANGALIRRLLPVLDDLELAFQNVPEELRGDAAEAASDPSNDGTGDDAALAWVAGFRQIHKKLIDLLQEEGATVIDCSGPFDPVRQEAISSEPSDTVASGHVIAPVRAGYEYKGRVLRPALVRVAL
jgi:molecular chaperone GrpE